MLNFICLDLVFASTLKVLIVFAFINLHSTRSEREKQGAS